jgi:hypothetical protein
VLFLDRVAGGSLSYGAPEPLRLTSEAVEEAARMLGIELAG